METGKKPNIIYILDDDHRSELMGYAGFPFLKTPNLDTLAGKGFVFENTFCTSPICTPSRCCHYMGQWERTHGVNFNSGSSISEEDWEYSFPMQLKKRGYFTGWVGKNHVPVGVGGYESGYLESSFDYWYGNHGHSRFYVKESSRGDIYKNAKADTQIEVFEEGAMNFLDPQKDFIESCVQPLPYRPGDKPFCLCITFNLPHAAGTGDMQLRASDDELYRSEYREYFNKFPLPETYKAFMDIRESRLPKDLYNGVHLPSYDYVRTPLALRERMVRTCQTITGIDKMIGNLIKKLEELNLSDNTIILFSSDHGIHYGEHGLGGKCFLYEEDIRIPLIIYDPRLGEKHGNKTYEEMVLVPDLAPTILDMAGAEIPDTMQGSSLLPLIKDQDVKWRKDFFTEMLMDIQNYPKSESVRNTNWKYIRYFARTEDPAQEGFMFRSTLDDYHSFLDDSLTGKVKPVYEELYNLKSDPNELNNLAKESKYKSVLEDMRRRLVELGRDARAGS